MRRFLWIAMVALLSMGCGSVYYPPPPQKIGQPRAVREILDMTGERPANTWGTIDSGVFSTFAPGSDWRWVSEHSAFHFKLDNAEGWSLSARITAVQAVLDKTGRQKVTFAVNGKLVATADLKVSQDYNFSVPIDAELLAAASPVAVTIDAGPCLPQRDGPSYCILLHTIGFIQEPS